MTTIIDQMKRMINLKQLNKLIILAGMLLIAGMAKAADYVLAYRNGNTVYYLARNGTTEVQRVTTFDPATCIWSCASNTAGTTAGTLNNNNTYGYLYQTVNGTRYFLGAPDADFALATNVPNNYYRWRTNGTYVYNRYSITYSYYINLANATPERNTNANTASNARPCEYTDGQTSSSSTTTLTVPTITPTTATLDYNQSQEFTASATATITTTTVPAHKTFTVNGNTYYYYNGTIYTSTNDFTQQTETHPDITYSWTLTGAANDYLSPTSGTGNPITITHSPQTPSDVSSTLSVTATAAGESQTSTSNATITAKASTVDPISVNITSSNPMTAYVDNTGNITYSLTPTPCYHNVTFTSANTSIATVSSTGVVTGVAPGQTTISVKAYKYSNPAQYVEATVTVNVRNICATPTITFEQIGNGSTATATITSTPGADIYYTINGATPTTSSTHYTTSFTVDDEDVVRAIAVMTGNSNWDDSEVAIEEYHACGTNDPTISYVQSGTTATVTITAETGATIYYTTNGTNPNSNSSSGTTMVTLNSVADGTTVKAYAKNPGCGASNIVSKVIVLSGVSGGVVTLNDREDHNWNYYQPNGGIDASYGYPSELCSPYPRNVKITYEGNGKMFTGDDNSSLTAASGVQVGLTSEGETQHTFVYYKTLERDANNRFPYEMIPNPFQVRPTYASDATTIYRGFYKWRITSITGGAIYDASSGGTKLADENTSFSSSNIYLDAYTTYYFQPTDNSLTNANNATSMEIAVEAVWARAAVSTTGVPTTYNSVERNFYVGTSNVFTGTNPGTCSSFYPNGTTNGTTAATMNNRSSISAGTAGADKRIEYYIITSGTVNTGGYKVDICRGVTNSGNTGITPLSGTHNDSDKNARLRLECGTYGGSTINLYGTPTTNKLLHLDLILGSDYDRAKGDNSKLSIAAGNTIQHGAHTATTNTGWLSFQHLDIVVKSGEIQKNYWSQTSAGYQYTFYCRSTLSTAGYYPGISYLTIEGGEFASVNGGRGNYQENVALDDDIVFSLRMKGGTIHGSIYGAASANPSHGGRRVVITGGTVEGWIAGGCDGTSSGGGSTIGDAYFYIGGNGIVGSSSRPNIDGTSAGNIFGAGRGMSNHGTSANPASMRNAYIAVADNGYVLRNVYGGGDYGYTGVTQSDGTISDQTAANFYILGGTVEGAVHGGGNNNNSACSNANITMTGGLVKGGIYGGSNNSGTMAYNVNIQVNGGQVGTDAAHPANIHGGGYGSATRVSGNVEITLGSTSQTTPGVTVYGDVYGGSALGYVNGTTAADTYHTYVTLNKGTINGSLYGGALGATGTAANVYGPVQVKVYGGSVNKTDANGANGSGGVYGANNINGAPQRSVTVDIYGTDPAPSADEYALFSVYGGGNQAAYTYGNGYPKVTVHNCNNSIEYVYGGGNAAAVASTDVKIYGGNKIGTVFGGGNGQGVADNFVMVSGNAQTNIYGGTILRVFAGNNTNGTISGNVTLNVNKEAESGHDSCPMKIGEVYGGGNLAAGKAGTVTIGCTGDLVALGDNEHYGVDQEGITYVYGGANQAGISNNIVLNINSGIVENVFGGNNTSGAISGSIQVNINKNNAATCASDWYVGNVFGGGNLAQYTGSPEVNILNGTVSGNVYGGGKGVLVDGAQHGVAGKVTGNPQVNIGDNVAGHTAIIEGEVYGGGDAADVAGTPVIVVNDCNTSIGYLYGGGNAADVNGTNITFYAGTVTHDAFGGGHGDKNASNPSKYADVNGNVVFKVYGGTFDRVFAGSNSKGSITGTSTLTIDKTGTCPMKIHEVYGGGW